MNLFSFKTIITITENNIDNFVYIFEKRYLSFNAYTHTHTYKY